MTIYYSRTTIVDPPKHCRSIDIVLGLQNVRQIAVECAEDCLDKTGDAADMIFLYAEDGQSLGRFIMHKKIEFSAENFD